MGDSCYTTAAPVKIVIEERIKREQTKYLMLNRIGQSLRNGITNIKLGKIY